MYKSIGITDSYRYTKPKQSVHIVAAADKVGGVTSSGDGKCGTDRIESNRMRIGTGRK